MIVEANETSQAVEELVSTRSHIDDAIYCHRSLKDPGYRVLDRPFHAYGIIVPIGYRWDGESAPLLFRWLVPKFDRSLMSSCIHDYLCSVAKNEEERRRADEIYRHMLIDAEQYSKQRAEWAYRGVRVGAFWGTGVCYPHFIKDNIWPVLRIS